MHAPQCWHYRRLIYGTASLWHSIPRCILAAQVSGCLVSQYHVLLFCWYRLFFLFIAPSAAEHCVLLYLFLFFRFFHCSFIFQSQTMHKYCFLQSLKSPSIISIPSGALPPSGASSARRYSPSGETPPMRHATE